MNTELKFARFLCAVFSFVVILIVLWFGFRHSQLALSLGSLFPRAFASLALVLAPLWLFGFGAAGPLKRLSGIAKVASPAVLSVAYFAFAIGTNLFSWRVALIVIAYPVLLAAFLETSHLPAKMTWRDAAVFGIIAATYYLRWLLSAWPPELAFVPKLFLADVALYCFLVVRRVQGSGYSLIPTKSAFVIGLREWAFFFPIALALGEATGFTHFHRTLPAMGHVAGSVLLTFLLIAIPEELFFRALLQNLVETRVGRNTALIIGAVLFGLSHFNHGSSFNWRYVLLASIAGVFYGRAWRAKRQIFASVVTHTAVDVVWSLWFK
ncbi:MAG TPA: CPBP family glutamic-type intramembrane protease [Terriglobales bacterium]|nr:CPBP family glutamic-type intramembrane protease [Terriglobales bacterium]